MNIQATALHNILQMFGTSGRRGNCAITYRMPTAFRAMTRENSSRKISEKQLQRLLEGYSSQLRKLKQISEKAAAKQATYIEEIERLINTKKVGDYDERDDDIPPTGGKRSKKKRTN